MPLNWGGVCSQSDCGFKRIYLLSALIMALLAYWMNQTRGRFAHSLAIFVPRSVRLHPSAITDYFYIALVMPLWSFLVVPHLVSSKIVTRHFLAATQTWLGPHTPIAMSPSATGLLYSVAPLTHLLVIRIDH